MPDRRTFLSTTIAATLAAILAQHAGAQEMDAESQSSFDTVMAFMEAMGGGDMDKMGALMGDDMVWHNEGDTSLPWIGESRGKKAIFAFLKVFSENLQTTKWENTDAFASGDTVAVFGVMNGITTHSGKERSRTALPSAKPITANNQNSQGGPVCRSATEIERCVVRLRQAKVTRALCSNQFSTLTTSSGYCWLCHRCR